MINEKTGVKIGYKASRLMKLTESDVAMAVAKHVLWLESGSLTQSSLERLILDIHEVAASALTQRPDRPKGKKRR